MARHIAKNIVAAGLAKECEIQLAYAVGVVEPVSVNADTYGSGVGDPDWPTPSFIVDRMAEAIRLGRVHHLFRARLRERRQPADPPHDRDCR